MEYLGRVDQQVKVRGYRVELGEIEAIMREHAGVEDVAVDAKDTPDGFNKLVGYVVVKKDARVNTTEIKSYLRQRLPEHMIPSAIIELDNLPLSPNGKVDRRALPDTGGQRPELQDEYVAPRTELENFIADIWREVLGAEAIGVQDNFFELNGDSIRAALVINKVQQKLGEFVHIVTLFDAPTVADFAAHLVENFPEAVSRIQSSPVDHARTTKKQTSQSVAGRVDESKVGLMRSLISPLAPVEKSGDSRARKNPSAVFVLSPPRSGSTLFRVMLAGHPLLFAPPELELLSFNLLKERKEAFSGRNSFWLEGAVRAIMEIRNCGAEEAQHLISECEEMEMSTQEFYALMQEWIGPRRLVDKTPSYSLDLEALKRAEESFDRPVYIHLVRHPYGMIRSFEEAKLDQVFFRHEHPFAVRELAELIWIISHQNILQFLDNIPEDRQYRIHFEELVEQPEPVLRDVCRFLGVEYHPDILRPYAEKKNRMADGIHPLSVMLGDYKFHDHKGIDAKVADKWKRYYNRDFLGSPSWQLAESFGYRRLEQPSASDTGSDEISPTSGLPPIDVLRRESHSEFPLSFTQQRLWFLDKLEPGHPAYIISMAVRLSGSLNVKAFEQALSEMMRRHEVMRTRFVSVNGRPIQVIGPPEEFRLPVVDLRGVEKGERDRLVREITAQEARTQFDLARGPVSRARLLHTDEDEHAVLLSMHHIISDGWSRGVIVREVAALYEAFCDGKKPQLAELPIQYADYAQWQQEWLQGEVLDSLIRYWREQLAGAPPVLDLTTDYPRSEVQTYRGTRHQFKLSEDLSAAIKAMSLQQGVTLFMTLLAAFKILLRHRTNSDDIVVGTDIANRNRAETEGLIGFFVNELALRTELPGNITFRELLRRVRGVTLGAYAHQDMPLHKLVDALNLKRHPDRSPLFQVCFLLQTAPVPVVDLPGLALTPMGVDNGTAKFEMVLDMLDTAHGLVGAMEYNTDLFKSATISAMLKTYEKILELVVEQPDVSLDDISERLREHDREMRAAEEEKLRTGMMMKFKSIRRKDVGEQ